jgi:hypothetical protein
MSDMFLKKKKFNFTNFAQNPALLLIYILIASVMVANIFVSGYLFGRAHQIIENLHLDRPLKEQTLPLSQP